MPTTPTPPLPFPWPTRAVGDFLGVREHTIHYVLRSGKLTAETAPPIVHGRRLWWPSHIRALAEILARKLTAQQKRKLAERAAR